MMLDFQLARFLIALTGSSYHELITNHCLYDFAPQSDIDSFELTASRLAGAVSSKYEEEVSYVRTTYAPFGPL
jgi:hypothetical protein